MLSERYGTSPVSGPAPLSILTYWHRSHTGEDQVGARWRPRRRRWATHASYSDASLKDPKEANGFVHRGVIGRGSASVTGTGGPSSPNHNRDQGQKSCYAYPTLCNAVKAVAWVKSERAMFGEHGLWTNPMDYSAFTNDSLTMMYEAVRGALAADDAAEEQDKEPPFRVRDTGAWMTHVADLEAEMIKRGMVFEFIAWDTAINGLTPGDDQA